MKFKMKAIKRILLFLIALTLFVTPVMGVYAQVPTSYTYNYDYWGLVMDSPDPYKVKAVLTSSELGLEVPLSRPEGLFVTDENMIYVCDTGNNRILEIKMEMDTYTVLRIIDSFQGDCEITTFNTPKDIYVADSGNMFIADTNNNRVVKLDNDLNYITEFLRPTDETFDQDVSFLPTKVVADDVERAYVIGTNVNKGVIKYETDGTFQGFMGANKVIATTWEYIKRKLQTKEQRERSSSFVPTEYENLYIDKEDFIYTCTTAFEEENLLDDKAMPIRRLNALGSDILIKNDWVPPIGDWDWANFGGYNGPSLITDITAMDDETYFALDKTRGRIFGYDDQGIMLYVFGGIGNSNGYFRKPIAIEHTGKDLLVLDNVDNSITIFTPTTYGGLINSALAEYDLGNYEKSSEYWYEVLKMNGNYTRAYIGIGRVLLREDRFKEAMEMFKVAYDDENYSKAFKLYRKEVIEDNIIYVFIGLFIIVAIWLVSVRRKKIKWEVADYESKFRKHR